MAHTPVLLKESIDSLNLVAHDVYLDATVGGGGHMEEVHRRMHEAVTLVGIDADETAIEIARTRLELSGAEPKLAVQNFRNIDRVPKLLGVARPTKILFDLGWNAMQFDSSVGEGRGFSFQKDEPLIMTFAHERRPETTTAHDVVNVWSEETLADVIYGYGEERFARRIAKAIVEARKRNEIKTSGELAEIVKEAVPIWYRFARIHPATRTFQAIRIAVNDELKALEEGLRKGFEMLVVGGRLAVISFHSLEDRIVKNFFKLIVSENRGELLHKKPITPGEQEIQQNPRSRSAKLRTIQKII